MNGDNGNPVSEQQKAGKCDVGSGLSSHGDKAARLKQQMKSNGTNNHILSPSKSKDHSSSQSKHSSSSKHKDGHHSSSSKSKDGHSSSKHSSSSHKEGSSSSKHKEGSSHSSSSKHGSSSSSSHKQKEGSSSTSKEKSSHSSSHSSRDKHSSSSQKHKHKDREREREKEVSSSSKEKHKESSSKPELKLKTELSEVKVKTENVSPRKVKTESGLSSPTKKVAPVKTENDSDDEAPLSVRKVKAEKRSHSDEDDMPLSAKKKIKVEEKNKKRKHEDSGDEFPAKRKKDKNDKTRKDSKSKDSKTSTTKKGKKGEETQEVWKWWEEERRDDGIKWTYLEHKGPFFAPAYERIPKDVRMKYDGHAMHLSEEAEEVAGFYARMIEHDYTTKDVFNKNFFKDWRKVMTEEERKTITDLKKCDFRAMHAHFQKLSEERKNRSKEEKKKTKEENEALIVEYGFCTIDGHKEKIGNFRIEPPGLFRGRGDHPKMGMLKKRIQPEDVIINCSKNSEVPKPPAGHKWKKVQHDNTVSWLANWTENVQGQGKYVMLNASSRLKGEKDWQKYEIARKLHKISDRVRANYREDWKSKEMRIRQRAVAMYFIDKLALRAGNEKETDEQADTVGCCSLRVEHVKLHEKMGDKECVVEFDFLGKDSIRYSNTVSVEKRVFKNLKLFVDHKQPSDDLFDRLNTAILNKHLQSIMDGLTAKVFRTYNASRTLQEQLDLLTKEDDAIPAKLLAYNRANRAVAVLCNHQRAAPKNFDKQMENLQTKITDKKKAVKDAKKQVKQAKADAKSSKSAAKKIVYDKKKKMLARLEEQLTKLEVSQTDKEENKEIALGTSKLNYLDPRISVAWCKKWEVPIEKIYNKTQREKFRWAIDMATADYSFTKAVKKE